MEHTKEELTNPKKPWLKSPERMQDTVSLIAKKKKCLAQTTRTPYPLKDTGKRLIL